MALGFVALGFGLACAIYMVYRVMQESSPRATPHGSDYGAPPPPYPGPPPPQPRSKDSPCDDAPKTPAKQLIEEKEDNPCYVYNDYRVIYNCCHGNGSPVDHNPPRYAPVNNRRQAAWENRVNANFHWNNDQLTPAPGHDGRLRRRRQMSGSSSSSGDSFRGNVYGGRMSEQLPPGHRNIRVNRRGHRPPVYSSDENNDSSFSRTHPKQVYRHMGCNNLDIASGLRSPSLG